MTPTRTSTLLLLLTLATSTLANRVPYYIPATPAPTARLLPALQARQTSSPTSTAGEGEDVDPLVASCSSAMISFLSVAPQVSSDLADWIEENISGTCNVYPTTDIPASLTSALSSLESHGSSFNCHESSLIELVMSTCAELPEFSASIHPIAEECQDSDPCGNGGDNADDKGEENAESDNDSDSNGAASRLMGVGAAAAIVVGSLVVAALQL
ncbi:hypothetical protein EDB80DRAFT_732948 [Ilyonectria destructans]|nr:hypothetical protein EDB80DRAFT_732948 [Ilyonectria destructans]